MEKYFETKSEFKEYFNQTEDDLACFFILSSDLTGLPVDLYADDSGSYKMFGHQLWVYFRNSYDKNSYDFIPVNVSQSEPMVPIGEYSLQISKYDLHAVKIFVMLHAKLLEQFANREINCEEVVTILKYSYQNYGISENMSFRMLNEMSVFTKEESGLPVDIWIDHGYSPKHGPRIKFKASKDQKNPHEYSSLTISSDPSELYMPKRPDISRKDIEILKAFIRANVDVLSKMHNASTSDEYIALRKKLITKYRIERGEVKFNACV